MTSALWVEFAGKRIHDFVDGKQYIDREDGRISGPGAVAVWTKADKRYCTMASRGVAGRHVWSDYMKWITRERPKIDRIACPWLVTRFIDQAPEFLFVPSQDVLRVAEQTGAIPYDIPGVELSHVGELCSFDAFLDKYQLTDPALAQLAVIVRGADTDRLDLAPEAPGLLALSLGLSHTFADDHEMLAHGMVMYDALYAWCQNCQDEPHGWPPRS